MKALLATGGCLVALCVGLSAAHAQTESEIRDRLCGHMEREKPFEKRRIQGKPAAIDCFNERHAIEIDWGPKWAEAVGQSLYYASQTGREPGIILICNEGKELRCLDYKYRLEAALAFGKIKATVWYCPSLAQSLDQDCLERSYGLSPSQEETTEP